MDQLERDMQDALGMDVDERNADGALFLAGSTVAVAVAVARKHIAAARRAAKLECAEYIDHWDAVLGDRLRGEALRET